MAVIKLVLFLATMSGYYCQPGRLVGGIGGTVQVGKQGVMDDPEISELRQALATVIKYQFVARTNSKPEQFDLVSYATQVVAGTNYFVKVQTGNDTYAHLRIFKPLPFRHKPMELSAVQVGKTLGDQLNYFDQDQLIPVTGVTAVAKTMRVNRILAAARPTSRVTNVASSPKETITTPTPIPIVLAGFAKTISLVRFTDVNRNANEIAELVNALQSTIINQYMSKTGQPEPPVFELVSYVSQVVAGTNYFAKVRVHDYNCVHLRIFKPLPTADGEGQTMELVAVQRGKVMGDAIGYFEPPVPAPILQKQGSTILPMVLAGGLSPVISLSDIAAANDSADEIAELKGALNTIIKAEYVKVTGEEPAIFELNSYSTQVVAGLNYFAKVQVNDNDYVHLRIFKPLPYLNEPIRLDGIERHKGLGDSIDYFEDRSIRAKANPRTTTLSAIEILPRQRLGGLGRVISLSDNAAVNANADQIAFLKTALDSIIKEEYKNKTGEDPAMFRLVSYAAQVVAGTNYFAKVQVSDSEYVHLNIFEPLPYTQLPMMLNGIQRNKGLNDEITYFQQEPPF